MNTLNLPERQLMLDFMDTSKKFDAAIDEYSLEDLARIGSLVERGYLLYDEPFLVPSEKGGWHQEFIGLRITEKGLWAMRQQ